MAVLVARVTYLPGGRIRGGFQRCVLLMGQWFGVVQLVARGNSEGPRGEGYDAEGYAKIYAENSGSRDFSE